MMKRREFGERLVSGVIGSGLAGSASRGTAFAQPAGAPRRNTLMHVGGDYHCVAGPSASDMASKTNLEYNLRYGVKHLTAQIHKLSPDGGWDLDELKRMKDNCDQYGVNFEAIRTISDSPDSRGTNYIRLRPGPERDRELDKIIGNIKKAAEVGVGILTYHWTVIPIRRNTRTPGRGGVTYAGFTLEDNWKDLAVGQAGRVTADDYWERITYFLHKVIPVCKQYDVKLACHPYDPPGLPFGYQGADNW
ncbi:MAG TPA: mannonate dehydratase, partial [Terriglobales bacterium]|nr:mannonate dehydratase [Terriglobales bacterium]